MTFFCKKMAFLLHDSNKIPKFAPMKQKKKELMMQEYGTYFLDMSKLIFGGIILAGIMNVGFNNAVLFSVGGLFVFIFAYYGFYFYLKSR